MFPFSLFTQDAKFRAFVAPASCRQFSSLKKTQRRRDAGATETFIEIGLFRKQLSPRAHEFQAMSACKLYNIPLHQTGLEEHPISRIVIPDEIAPVQSDPYDTEIFKRRTWPIYLIHFR